MKYEFILEQEEAEDEPIKLRAALEVLPNGDLALLVNDWYVFELRLDGYGVLSTDIDEDEFFKLDSRGRILLKDEYADD